MSLSCFLGFMLRADGGGNEGGEDTTNNRGFIFVKCWCQTMDGWAEAELEAYSKWLIANARKTTKRKKGGAGRQEAVLMSDKIARNNGGGCGKCEDDDSIVKLQNGQH
jgi:hypothetical protein